MIFGSSLQRCTCLGHAFEGRLNARSQVEYEYCNRNRFHSVWLLYYTCHVNKLRDAVNSKCEQLELHERGYLLSISPPNMYVSFHHVGRYNRAVTSSSQGH